MADSRSPTRPPSRPILGLFLLLPSLIAALAAGEDLTNRFQEANRAYEQADYPTAIAHYQTILAAGRNSAALQFNLGNALFRNGRVGEAILHYRQAELLSPRDPDIRANLRFVRQTVGTVSNPPLWRQALRTLRLDEWTLLSISSLWTLLALLVARELRPPWARVLRLPQLIAVALTLLLAMALAAAWLDLQSQRSVIVVRPDTIARYGPVQESRIHFTARDGTELSYLDRQGGWVQVSDAAGRIGWLLETDALLFPP